MLAPIQPFASFWATPTPTRHLKKTEAAGVSSDGLCPEWLPVIDRTRTLFLNPPPELKQIFAELRDLDWAA
jgi:hypothetical protein